jgi:LCCL domain
MGGWCAWQLRDENDALRLMSSVKNFLKSNTYSDDAMKVLQELVGYFDRKGKLTPKQLKTLLDQGFLASDAPANMVDLCDTIGATYYFRLQGTIDGPVWGTDVYTGDSMLAPAAVHAGVVKDGEWAIVKVTVLRPPASYQGSLRKGVTSNHFGRYGSAYKVEHV